MRLRAFRKDALREIRKTFDRFLAILAIVALGTAFFVGIRTTNPDMKATADRYFTTSHFMDLQVFSTVGFTADEVAALRAQPGVAGAMPFDFVDAVTTVGANEKVLRVESMPDAGSALADSSGDLNRPRVLEGRLPERSGECAVQNDRITDIAYRIGDRIVLSDDAGGDLSGTLATSTYTVVGIVDSPLYLSRDHGTTTIGTGQVATFLLVPLSDFRQDYFSSLFLAIATSDGEHAYTTAYDDRAAAMKDAIAAAGTTLAARRRYDLRVEADAALSEQVAAYAKAESDAYAQLADAWMKIEDGRRSLDDGRAQLADARSDAAASFADAAAAIAAVRTTLAAQQAAWRQQQDALDAAIAQAIQLGVYDAQKAVFDAQQAQLDLAAASLAQAAADLDAKAATLAAAKKAAAKEFASTQATLDRAQADLDAAVATYEANRSDAATKLADARAALADGKAKVDALPAVEWTVLDRQSNVGYVDYGQAADRLDAIAKVFPILFVLVAVLIVFAAMSRMVEEQRGAMGLLKALGYTPARIAGKFLAYAASASVLGGAAGLAVGFAFFPLTIYDAYAALYTVPDFVRLVDVPFALEALAVGVAVPTLAALAVCVGELRSPAATLLRPRAPKPGRTILLERIRPLWRRMSFTWKVTARNLLRYRARFLMTVAGVGGCTALLVVGFGLRDAVRDIGTEQYGHLFLFQATVALKDGIPPEQRTALEAAVRGQPGFAGAMDRRLEAVTVGVPAAAGASGGSAGGDALTKDATLYVPADVGALSDFVVLRDRRTHAVVPLTDEGVVLTEKLADKLGLSPGDAVSLTDADGNRVETVVTGITENYLRHFVYMTSALYRTLRDAEPVSNGIMVDLDSDARSAQQAFSAAVAATPGVAAVVLTADNLAKFSDTIRTIHAIVLILIVSAGLLSFVVLYTLTDINITERTREIATIKVLGFRDREVTSYIFRENLILTAIGTTVGLLAGASLSGYVVGTAEVDIVMFSRTITAGSFATAAAMTFAFSLGVILAMVARLRRIDMIEALKSPE